MRLKTKRIWKLVILSFYLIIDTRVCYVGCNILLPKMPFLTCHFRFLPFCQNKKTYFVHTKSSNWLHLPLCRLLNHPTNINWPSSTPLPVVAPPKVKSINSTKRRHTIWSTLSTSTTMWMDNTTFGTPCLPFGALNNNRNHKMLCGAFGFYCNVDGGWFGITITTISLDINATTIR